MKRNLYLMYAIALLQGMVFYGPIATLYRQAQGVSVFQITLIESLSMALAVALEIPWGVIADKIGYRRTMIFCSVLFFLSKLVFWQARGFSWFLVERIMLSVVMAGTSGVDSSIIYLSCAGQDSHRAFSIYYSLSTWGLLAAAGVFSLWVGDNYPLAGLLTAVSYGGAAILSFGLKEVKGAGPSGQPQSSARSLLSVCRETLRDRRLLLFLAAAALVTEAHQTITVFLGQLQFQRVGMGSAGIGLVHIATIVIGLCGVWSAAMTRRLGERGSFLLLCGLAAAACLTLAGNPGMALSIGGILALRLAHSLFEPFQVDLQNRQIRTENRATALSVNSMLMKGVAVATNLAFGALSERSLSAAFLFGGMICLLSLGLFALWGRRASATPS